MGRTIKVRKSRPLDRKVNYHEAIWRDDNWLHKLEQHKVDTEKLTEEEARKNKELGLPVMKVVEPKYEEKPLIYMEEDN